MPFSKSTKRQVRRLAGYRCCVCQKPRLSLDVHHIIEESELDEADPRRSDIDNAAPLCAGCHDDFGGNPAKRARIREMRDYLYEEVAAAKASVDLAPILALAESVDEIRSGIAAITAHLGLPAQPADEPESAEATEDRVVANYLGARDEQVFQMTALSMRSAGYGVWSGTRRGVEVDLVAEKDGRTILIETKQWDRVPPRAVLDQVEQQLSSMAAKVGAHGFIVVASEEIASQLRERGVHALSVETFEEEASEYEGTCQGCAHFAEHQDDGHDGDIEIWWECTHPKPEKELDSQLWHAEWGERNASDYPTRCSLYE